MEKKLVFFNAIDEVGGMMVVFQREKCERLKLL